MKHWSQTYMYDLILTQFHMQIALMVRLALNKVIIKPVIIKLWEDLKSAVTTSGFPSSTTPIYGIQQIQ